MSVRTKIYRAVHNLVGKERLSRSELVERVVLSVYGICCPTVIDIGEITKIRGEVGAVLTEMEEKGIVAVENELYTLSASKPVALRAEHCEKEILSLLKGEPMSKTTIRSRLERFFGTDRTPTLKDDNILYTLIGQVLKRLVRLGIIKLEGGEYSIAPDKFARLDDIDSMLTLRGDFLTRLHAKGGEFFEHYIMTLLGKHMQKQGKTVLENRTVGSARDGGIDGIMRTVDYFGFRETVMVQAKNRTDQSTETTVRGFYGAVCAAKGSRGIFATTSDFHEDAARFLDSIDNCVGIDGEKIFRMAVECEYGIKKRGGKYVIDTKVL